MTNCPTEKNPKAIPEAIKEVLVKDRTFVLMYVCSVVSIAAARRELVSVSC